MTGLRIGIPIIGGKHWMAGVTYVEMLARSVQTLDPPQRPEVFLVAQPDTLPHMELHNPFLGLFKGVIILVPPAMDRSPLRGTSFTVCGSREELFDHIDFYFPLLGDVWEEGCTASWIPDFQHRFLPEFFPDQERAGRDLAFGKIAARAKRVILSSETVREDFRKLYPGSPATTHVLSFFAFTEESAFLKDPGATASRYSLPDRYLLCCNQFWIHKDHTTLLKAVASLRDAGERVFLACTGSTSDYRFPGYFRQVENLITELGIGDQVKILGMIPREDQIQLIRRSCALVHPSRFEGWSSIVEDARSLGKTIFLSDLDVHKEQAPPDGRFFKTGDPTSLADCLRDGFSGLVPGPDAAMEKRARLGTQVRARDFGALFVAMAEEAVTESRKPVQASPPHVSSIASRPPENDPVPAAAPSSADRRTDAAADWTPKSHSHRPDFEIERAETALAEGRPEEALRILDPFVVGHPGNARALNDLGVAHHSLKNPKEARRRFLDAVKADPDYGDAVSNLADSLGEIGLYREAIGLCYRYLDNRPDDSAVLSAGAAAEEGWADRMLAGSLIRDLNYRKRDYPVSVVVSTYKSAAFMRECLEDLLRQSIADDIEIVVVDAASPEDEGAIVEEFQRRRTNIRYIRTPERIGIYPAWNLAIRASCGTYITPFSTNDGLNPDAYRIMRDVLDKRPEAALVYGDSDLTNIPHQRFGSHAPTTDYGGMFRWPEYSFEDLMMNCRVGPHPMWRRSVHREVGYFDGRYKAIGDQDFWLRLGVRHELLHIPVVTGLAWITPDSLSGESSSRDEIVAIHQKHTRAYLNRLKSPVSPPAASPADTGRAHAPGRSEASAGGDRMKATAIVSTYASERFLRGCLENLAAQTLFRAGGLEIVVVDSGSPEGERAIAEEFVAAHPGITYLRTRRETLYAAWNRAVRTSTGRYLVNANTDDRHRADAFERMSRELDRRKEGLVYADALLTEKENETFAANSARRVWTLPEFSVRQALVDCPFGCVVMWRRDLHARFGEFDPAFRIAGDYEFFLKASLGAGAWHLREPLALYFESMKNLSYGDQNAVDQEVDAFLPRYRRELDLASIYPWLRSDPSAVARAAAHVDLAGLFLHPLARMGAAEAEYHLRLAMETVGGKPEILGNLFHALLMQRKAESARDTYTELNRTDPTIAARITQGYQADPPQRILFHLPHPGLSAMPAVAFAPNSRVPLSEYRAPIPDREMLQHG